MLAELVGGPVAAVGGLAEDHERHHGLAEVYRRLTTRQVDVLALVALGLTNEGIAASLGLSSLTVKSYLRSAMARLDARTRYEAVVEARRHQIIP